ncbi:RluA family pseudouridine synthase [Buchnera aphidicola (Stegophylla sp.)]|uniref:Pseudouridine synthase n=1 Tax=Buchnera aphidicola (Stegophylla sp.) TaxID=2315800 RepID=A0A4D6YLA4_9GAMM|nr:RluA family pseudouridine synthase [Buchnera aphidicola (Stegophylla sp.)]
MFPNYSRSILKKYIISRQVLINFLIIDKPNFNVFPGDKITIFLDVKEKKYDLGENIPLNIIYEDNNILIINKLIGCVVHPACGNVNGTLLNALLYYDYRLKNVPRGGIIHRLDKNTTGLMVIAKDVYSYEKMVFLLKKRLIIREYDALVCGHVISGGVINYPIMRHIKKRICMMTNISGKTSVTHYRVIQQFKYYTHLRIRIETGRTHQIRVHMLHIRHPILGDLLYNNNISTGMTHQSVKKIRLFSRQALHASTIAFIHPVFNKLMRFQISLPIDILHIMQYL